MKKQTIIETKEPKKPKIVMINGNGIQCSHCPTCGERIDEYHNENYCGKCGQKLRWLE